MSRVTVAQMIQHLKKFIFVREFEKNGFRGLFKYLVFAFYLFVKKGFLCAYYIPRDVLLRF